MSIQSVSFEGGILFEGPSKRKSALSLVSLLLVVMLLLLRMLSVSILGHPKVRVLEMLGLAIALTTLELLWLQFRGSKMTEKEAKIECGISITATFILTALLTYFSNRDENPYYVLLAIPIVQCAYTFGLLLTGVTIAAADGMIFLWLKYYFSLHPPARITEYFEGWVLSIVYLQMGLLVWFLVNQLKANQMKLSTSLKALENTRDRLVSEEKLAAIGRLASGIAHEIRNPVAMISSSLSTANEPALEDEERKEMFAIVERESKRLEVLTSDFLIFAKPTRPRPSPVQMDELLSNVAGATRAHAAIRSIAVVLERSPDIPICLDATQVEGALLNLVLNAIDATPEGGTINLTASMKEDVCCIDITNSGPPIPEADRHQIFEPFFTTKPAGTGLGLAIARSAARAHGGELWLSDNRDGSVTFSMTLATSIMNYG